MLLKQAEIISAWCNPYPANVENMVSP